MPSTDHHLRLDTPLSTSEIKVLVKGIKSFLETCRLTPDAKTYLKYNPEFAQVIEKL